MAGPGSWPGTVLGGGPHALGDSVGVHDRRQGRAIRVATARVAIASGVIARVGIATRVARRTSILAAGRAMR